MIGRSNTAPPLAYELASCPEQMSGRLVSLPHRFTSYVNIFSKELFERGGPTRRAESCRASPCTCSAASRDSGAPRPFTGAEATAPVALSSIVNGVSEL